MRRVAICKAVKFPFPDDVTGGAERPLKYLDIVGNPKFTLLAIRRLRKARTIRSKVVVVTS